MRYDVQVLRGLSNSTFRGARANALLVKWTSRTRTAARIVAAVERHSYDELSPPASLGTSSTGSPDSRRPPRTGSLHGHQPRSRVAAGDERSELAPDGGEDRVTDDRADGLHVAGGSRDPGPMAQVVSGHSSSGDDKEPAVIRGGLPLFEVQRSRSGIPLVHSTAIARLAETGSTEHCPKVRPIARGVVCGVLLLLPRVGVPLREYVSVVRVTSPIQLSDCVFSLCFSSIRKAEQFRNSALESWGDLVNRYRGTGARYISVAEMNAWVRSVVSSMIGDLEEEHATCTQRYSGLA
jgi:hypothetical protein